MRRASREVGSKRLKLSRRSAEALCLWAPWSVNASPPEFSSTRR